MRPTLKALAAAICILAAPGAFAQFVMKMSSPTTADVNHEWMKAFKAGFEASSGGKVKVEVYPAGQLGSMQSTVDGVAMGTIEVAFVSSGFLVGLEPRYQVFDAAGLFDTVQHGQQIFDDEDVRKRVATFGESRGVMPLTNYVHSFYAVASKKPIKSLADFKGLKVRVFPTPMQIEPMKRLGATPTPMSLGDVLPALQNGTIDASLSGSTVFTAFKYYDSAKTSMYLPGWTVIASAIINRNFVKSLPPDLQALLWQEAKKADAAAARWNVVDNERTRRTWEQNGGTNLSLSDADQKRLVDEVTTSVMGVMAKQPAMKTDYDALVAASRKYRK